MKKINFALAAIFALTFVGCQKESVKDLTPATITLNGIYAESLDVVKSDYELSGTTYNFKWVANDKFIAQSYNSSTTTYGSTLFTATAGNAVQVPFTGTPASGYELSTYAFYPNDGASGNTNLTYLGGEINPVAVDADVTAVAATVSLAGTITEVKDHPMAHIPMIGVKNGDGDYQFTACTGVLKITIKDLPITATLIKVERAAGSNFPLNGSFVFDINREIKASYIKGTAWGQKYLNITPGTSVENRSFYIPLPTGTIGAGEINIIVSDGTNNLYMVTNKVAITLSKGVVTELPAFTFQSLHAKVTVSGSLSKPILNIGRDGSVVKVRACISTNATNDLSKYPSGLFFSNKYASYDLTSWTGDGKISGSNKYYLHWVALNTDVEATVLSSLEDVRIVAYNTIPFYYLTTEDKEFAGTYKFDALYCLAFCDRSAWRDLTESSDNRLVLEVSDNPSKGSVMITDYMGLKSDGTVTNKNLTNSDSNSIFDLKAAGTYLPREYLNPALFAPGTRVYGWLNHSNGHISFENTANQSLFNYNGVAYTLRNGIASYPGFIFEYDKSASPKKITYGSGTPLTLVPYNADVPGSGTFDGATSMLYPSKSNSSAQGGIVGYKQ